MGPSQAEALARPRTVLHKIEKYSWSTIQEEEEEENVSGSSGGGEGVPLYGGIATLGEYYVKMRINGQKMRLQIDTGSSSLLVAGEGCVNCTTRTELKWDNKYAVPCDGKTCFQCFEGSAYCGFRLKYGDDTPQYNLEASGVVLLAKAKIKDEWEESENVPVYVIQKEIGVWPKKVDGILGMAFPKLNCNPTCFRPAWQTLSPPKSRGFTICLGDLGGVMSFYGDDQFKSAPSNAAKMIKAAVIGDPKMYYAVKSRGLAIEDQDVLNRYLLFSDRNPSTVAEELGNFAIIDSGTTLLIIPRQTWKLFVGHMKSRYCHLPGVCGPLTVFDRPQANQAVCLTENPFDQFPTLSIVLDDGVIKIPPQLYFIEYKPSVFCLAIQPGPALIVGDAVLRGFSVSYELDAVIFSTARPTGCGQVPGLTTFDDLLIDDQDANVGYIHHSLTGYSMMKRLASLAVFLIVFFVLAQSWRRYMRRRLGYTQI